MSARGASWLTWSLSGMTAALLVAMVSLPVSREPVFVTLLYGLLSLSQATVGALVASRRPRNPIGWLFCSLALYGVLAECAEEWGYLAADEGLPAGEVGEWIIMWSWVGELTVWPLVLLLFPNGHLPTRRWRVVPWIAAAGCALALPGQALNPDRGAEFTGGTNPFAVEGLPLDLFFGAGMALLLIVQLAAIASLVVRFRRAGDVERQQLKWFALAAGCIVLVTPLAIWYESVFVQVAAALAFIGLPIAAGIAILKHRLYDIDVIINRTLVYGTLTIFLALVYVTSVVLMQMPLRALTGGGSQLVIVASTLVIAALFNPLRRRVQSFVDRRFYRGKYDAEKVLQAFSARLRDETGLEDLSDDLVVVTRETVQPAHVSMWLRMPETRTGEAAE